MSEANLEAFLAYVKGILGITVETEDDELESYIKASYNFIWKMTSIYYLKEDPEGVIFLLDGGWNRSIFLPKRPVTTRTSLEYNAWTQNTPDWTIVDRDNYTIDQKKARITYTPWFPRWFQNLRAKYILWYDRDDVPQDYEDLKFAVVKMVWVARDLVSIGAIKSESVSWTTIQYTQEFKDSWVGQIIDSYSNFGL